MSDAQGLQHQIETALAYAYAAVDEPTDDRVVAARRYAEEVLPRIDALSRIRRIAFTLTEASGLLALVARLRAVLALLDKRQSGNSERTPGSTRH